MAKTRDYNYQPPSYDATVDRAERKGSMFDSLFKDVKFYRTKQGANLLRILPPGWPNAKHYGLTVMIHRGVGPDDRQYLCLRENPTSPYKRCPICEELYNLGAKATQEDKNQLRPKSNLAYYVIDRDNENDGVQVWVASPTIDSEIAAQSVNRRSKSVIDIVHPEDGYDIEFTRSGTGRNNTRYRGFQIMRESSPLAESAKRMDEWLNVAFDKPLPSLLQFYSPERIEEVFYGQAKEDAGSTEPRRRSRDDDDERPSRLARRGGGDEEEEDQPSRSRRGEEDADEQPAQRSRRGARDDSDAETEERPSRRRRAPDDDDGESSRPARSRGRSRDDDDDDDDDTRGSSRASGDTGHDAGVRSRRSEPDDEDDRPARSRGRTRSERELDDEIPSEGGRRARPNGRDDSDTETEERPSRRRRTLDDDDVSVSDESRRSRLRERLNRE